MGTSSMYKGPSGNSLLPSDFEDPLLTDDMDCNEEEHQENEGKQNDDINSDVDSNSTDSTNESESSNENISNKDAWRNAKSFMSRIASGNSSNYRRGLSSYVKAYGGASKAAKSASSGTKTTVSLGRFISSAYGANVRNVLEGYKIDYEGRSAVDILSELINFIAPIPVTKEDSIARKALIRTMEKLYELIVSTPPTAYCRVASLFLVLFKNKIKDEPTRKNVCFGGGVSSKRTISKIVL